MKISALLNRNDNENAIVGTARYDENTQALIRRIKPGEIAVLDELDLDRSVAEQLVEKKVAAVVNASSFISGRFPNLAPEVLILADIKLIENVGSAAVRKFKDGMKVTLIDGEVRHGGKTKLSGYELGEVEIAERIIAARSAVTDHLEAFASNAIEFIRSESSLLIDGIGVPEIDINIKGKLTVVVDESKESARELQKISAFIKEYNPVMVGVNRGADIILSQGYTPDIVVGDPDRIGTNSLRAAKTVILPAEPDGKAKGLHRIQDLGIGAMTFPARGQAVDLALLLVDHHQANLIVTVGHRASFEDFFDQKHASTTPSTFLTRLKMGEKLVDSRAVASLYRTNLSMWVVAFFILLAAAFALAVLTATGFIEPLHAWFSHCVLSMRVKIDQFMNSLK